MLERPSHSPVCRLMDPYHLLYLLTATVVCLLLRWGHQTWQVSAILGLVLPFVAAIILIPVGLAAGLLTKGLDPATRNVVQMILPNIILCGIIALVAVKQRQKRALASSPPPIPEEEVAD